MMKIVRNAVLKENKSLFLSILFVSIGMLLLTFCNITIDFTTASPALMISFMNTWALVISVIPFTWIICIVMLMKTKKIMFSKLPAYIFCCVVLLAMIVLFIALDEKYLVYKILGFSVGVLLVYPFVIATLTIEGRMYNRVFATIFSSILLLLSIGGAIAVCIILKTIILSTLIPALIYVNLILIVLCYDLEKLNKTQQKKEKLISH